MLSAWFKAQLPVYCANAIFRISLPGGLRHLIFFGPSHALISGQQTQTSKYSNYRHLVTLHGFWPL